MKKILTWIGIAALVIAVGGGIVMFLTGRLALSTGARSGQASVEAISTIKIQPAANVIGQVSASGKIGLVETNYVVLDVSGTVHDISANVGDSVQIGDTLLSLDTAELERSAKRAELSVASAKNSLAQLEQPASDMELAAAEADLVSAQQKLEDAKLPATEAEMSAAKASVSSAWAKYNEILAPKSDAEITKLEAALRKAEITMAEKQRAYDKIKWRNDVGMTSEAAALQQATIEYESAKADYEISTKGADQSEIQSALSSARSAEKQLNDLLAKPDKANIASAESQVATAQQKLDDLKQGKGSLEIEAAQIKLEQALVDLEEAYTNRAKAKVTAPVSGVILSLDVEKGQHVATGATIAKIANLGSLQVTVDVAEVDIDEISIGQSAEVSVDALPGKTFNGTVLRVSPVSSSSSGVVNYEITILLDQTHLAGVRPDMTAVAKMQKDQVVSGWLVPTASIQQINGAATVTIVRNGTQQHISVSTGQIQGEWTVVESPELQSGDSVVGSVTTFVNDSNNAGFGPRGGGPPGGGG